MMSIAYPTQAFNDVMELENLQSLNFYSSEDYKTDIMLEQLTGCHMASTFLSPSAPKSPSFNDYKLGNGAFCQNSLLSWTAKHPEHWSSVEVLDWLYYMADLHQVNSKKFRGEAFQNMSGPRLCQMTRREFVKLEPEYGSRIYDILQAMLSDAKFNEPTTYDYSSLDTPTSQIIHDRLFTTLQPVDKMDIEETNMLHNDSQSLSLLVDDSEVRVSMDGYWYDIDIPSKIDFPDADGGYVSGGSDASQESCGDGLQSRLGSCSSDVFEPAASNDGLSVQHKNFKTRCPYGNRLRCGSSTSVDEGFGCEEKGKSRGTRRLGHGSKGNHLWEFIRDLLKNPTYSPSLLKWEDKESGVFRFVQSEAVAQMWGRKKNNPGMTYEKLSRAMRYYYKRGILVRVDGRRLVYKFGPSSHGWKE